MERQNELKEWDGLEIREPRHYRVILLNDDYTTQEFVVDVLQRVFHKLPGEAKQIMLNIHNQGKAVVGHYPYDMARTKLQRMETLARQAGFPLRGRVERV